MWTPFARAGIRFRRRSSQSRRRELGRSQREAALRWLGDLLAKSPDNILALSMRVGIFVLLGQLDEARVDVERLKGLTPSDAKEGVQKEMAIADVVLADGRYEEGIAALDRAIALEGANQDHLRAARAGTMETFGRQDEARAAFDEALAFNPELSTAMCGRASWSGSPPTIR